MLEVFGAYGNPHACGRRCPFPDCIIMVIVPFDALHAALTYIVALSCVKSLYDSLQAIKCNDATLMEGLQSAWARRRSSCRLRDGVRPTRQAEANQRAPTLRNTCLRTCMDGLSEMLLKTKLTQTQAIPLDHVNRASAIIAKVLLGKSTV